MPLIAGVVGYHAPAAEPHGQAANGVLCLSRSSMLFNPSQAFLPSALALEQGLEADVQDLWLCYQVAPVSSFAGASYMRSPAGACRIFRASSRIRSLNSGSAAR